MSGMRIALLIQGAYLEVKVRQVLCLFFYLLAFISCSPDKNKESEKPEPDKLLLMTESKESLLLLKNSNLDLQSKIYFRWQSRLLQEQVETSLSYKVENICVDKNLNRVESYFNTQSSNTLSISDVFSEQFYLQDHLQGQVLDCKLIVQTERNFSEYYTQADYTVKVDFNTFNLSKNPQESGLLFLHEGNYNLALDWLQEENTSLWCKEPEKWVQPITVEVSKLPEGARFLYLYELASSKYCRFLKNNEEGVHRSLQFKVVQQEGLVASLNLSSEFLSKGLEFSATYHNDFAFPVFVSVPKVLLLQLNLVASWSPSYAPNLNLVDAKVESSVALRGGKLVYQTKSHQYFEVQPHVGFEMIVRPNCVGCENIGSSTTLLHMNSAISLSPIGLLLPSSEFLADVSNYYISLNLLQAPAMAWQRPPVKAVEKKTEKWVGDHEGGGGF